jgi:glycosidase
VDIDHGSNGKFSPRTWRLNELKAAVSKQQVFMHSNGGWNALYLENHDQPRSIN